MVQRVFISVVIASCFGIAAIAAPVPELSFTIEFDGEDFTGKRFNLWPESTVGVEILFSLSEGGAVGAGL